MFLQNGLRVEEVDWRPAVGTNAVFEGFFGLAILN
jgi:hypothetical protein